MKNITRREIGEEHHHKYGRDLVKNITLWKKLCCYVSQVNRRGFGGRSLLDTSPPHNTTFHVDGEQNCSTHQETLKFHGQLNQAKMVGLIAVENHATKKARL